MAAANNQPIYSRVGDIQWIGPMSTANSTADLTSGTSYLAFTAGGNGSFVSKVRFKANTLGTATGACIARVWINNSLTTGTAANSVIYDEITLPATTPTTTAAAATYEIPLNFALPAGYKIYITVGAVGSAFWNACVVGGDY